MYEKKKKSRLLIFPKSTAWMKILNIKTYILTIKHLNNLKKMEILQSEGNSELKNQSAKVLYTTQIQHFYQIICKTTV